MAQQTPLFNQHRWLMHFLIVGYSVQFLICIKSVFRFIYPSPSATPIAIQDDFQSSLGNRIGIAHRASDFHSFSVLARLLSFWVSPSYCTSDFKKVPTPSSIGTFSPTHTAKNFYDYFMFESFANAEC